MVASRQLAMLGPWPASAALTVLVERSSRLPRPEAIPGPTRHRPGAPRPRPGGCATGRTHPATGRRPAPAGPPRPDPASPRPRPRPKPGGCTTGCTPPAQRPPARPGRAPPARPGQPVASDLNCTATCQKFAARAATFPHRRSLPVMGACCGHRYRQEHKHTLTPSASIQGLACFRSLLELHRCCLPSAACFLRLWVLVKH